MRTTVLVATLVLADAAAAQQPPAIRKLGATVAASRDSFGPAIAVRHLKGGVLLNDIQNRRLLYLDNALSNPTVVADTTPATGNAYAGRMAGLLAYKGDSSLFVDPQSLSMLVVDPSGKLTGRVMSVPRSQDAMFMANAIGNAAIDNQGRVIYRGMPRIQMRPMTQSANGTPIMSPPDVADSAAVVRINLATRVLDTVGFVKVPKVKMDVQTVEGRTSMRSIANPLPVVDEFATLSDGSVAFVRGRDYHVDWVRPDGSRSSSAKMPFDWQRLTEEDKIAFLDSVKAYREKMGANAPLPGMGGTPNISMQFGGGPGGGPPPGAVGGGGRQTIVQSDGPGGRPGASAPTPGGPAAQPQPVLWIPPDELPDYKPPFFAGMVRADADGQLWIRTIPTKAIAGGPVYDVINGKGELVERVQIPEDRTIIGFGAGGVVYLRVGSTGRIERASDK